MYCKGADTVILERLGENQPYTEKTLVHLEDYATDGLRTLCIAYREVSEQEYQQWSKVYNEAAATINGRGEALDKAAELIEKDLFLLGATAIEDKLQEGVPDTIHTLQMAGIKVSPSLCYSANDVAELTLVCRYGFSLVIDKKPPSTSACRAALSLSR